MPTNLSIDTTGVAVVREDDELTDVDVDAEWVDYGEPVGAKP